MIFGREGYFKWVLSFLICILIIISPAIAASPSTIFPSMITAPTVHLSDDNYSIGSISVSSVYDVEMIYLTLKFDPTIGVVETIKPNTSVISNIELLVDSQTEINNGGCDAGTVRATLQFPDSASIQNTTPILDVIFRPTNKSGEIPLSLKSQDETIYSSYKKIGATTYVQFDQYREGELVSNGLGDPFLYQGTMTAPKFILETGYKGEGSIYIENLENIRNIYIQCNYNSEIHPIFEVNKSFTELKNSGRGTGYLGETSYQTYRFKSDEDVSIIEPRAILDLSITSQTEGNWSIIIDPYCSYTAINDDGIPIVYPFNICNDIGLQVISKSTDTTIQIRDVTLSSNQSVAGIVEVKNLADVKNIYFTLIYDPAIGVVETIRPNTSVISNAELLVSQTDIYQTKIFNGGPDAGTIHASLQFSESVSLQNTTPILDVIFRATNKSGEIPLSLKSQDGTIYSSYKKMGATVYVRFDQCREGELVSNGLGDPFPYQGTMTAPKFILETGYKGEGSIYIENLENIRNIYIRCNYNSEIHPIFEVNQSFTDLKNYCYTRAYLGETSYQAYRFKSAEDVSIIEPRAILDLSITSSLGVYCDIIMDLGCSYTIINGDGIPVQYPFKLLNDVSIRTIIYGDANGDGVVNQADTLNLLKIITGIIPHPSDSLLIEQSDVHRNGVIDVGDAMFIAQYNVGLRDQWFGVTAG